MSDWSTSETGRLYHLEGWSSGFFAINRQGDLVMTAGCEKPGHGIALPALARRLADEGLHPPVLVRFEDILERRVRAWIDAFANARKQQNYQGGYTAVYPVKVNQQRVVIEQILQDGGEYVGLEAGSKAEFLAVLGLSKPGSVIICNGYKDREYIRLALIGILLNRKVIIVIEKPDELRSVIHAAKSLQVKPRLGVRVRLAAIARGNWQNTGGEKGKFGLTAAEVLALIDTLKKNDLLDCLELLHFHMGSQISGIEDIGRGLTEAAQYFAEIKKLGAPLRTVDVGGGFGVDYEGIRSGHEYSINYRLQDYADRVVQSFCAICAAQDLPHPDILTECGRAMTAHHAMLITDVVDAETRDFSDGNAGCFAPFLKKSGVTDREKYEAAERHLQELQQQFSRHAAGLKERAAWEQQWGAFCRQLMQTTKDSNLADLLREKLADKYFLNLSFFQSIPDVWGLGQIFPVLPLQRLHERPDRSVILQDLTCDSDGRIDTYAHSGALHPVLPLHQLRAGEQYLLGIFLVGAYQEILGDMHNLFGDTHAVNVRCLPGGQYEITETEAGDRIEEILCYVHHAPQQLISRYKKAIVESGLPEKTQRQLLAVLEKSLGHYSYLQTEEARENT